jgi:NAD+ synthase
MEFENNFNAEIETQRIINWIKEFFDKNGPDKNCIIGISGGKDSTIIAKLLVEALGKDRVIGVTMPNGIQIDIDDSKKIIDLLGIKSFNININNAYNGLLGELKDIEIKEDTKINLPPRLRMATLYAIAQSFNGFVVNTCNKSEHYIGYSTKFGDGAGDFSPCSEYLVYEMLQIGDYLNLPKELIHKTPSDGLCGQTDEDKLGFTYNELDNYILTGKIEDEIKKEKIERLHKANLHKMKLMPKCERN